MYQEILAGGKESEDVQFKSRRSPISYSACKFPVICGPSLGKSENIDPQNCGKPLIFHISPSFIIQLHLVRDLFSTKKPYYS